MESSILGQRGLQEFWGSAQCWLTSISATMTSAAMTLEQPGQKVLQESWRNAEQLTLITLTIRSGQPGQRVLQECWGSAQGCLISISAAICSKHALQRVLQECWAQPSAGAAGAEREACRSSGAVRSAGSPQSRRQWHRNCRGREASSFVAWSSLCSSLVCTACSLPSV